jgi:uncharacterized protein
LNRSEILLILEKFKRENANKYGIDSLGLFGSFAKDQENDNSDVDIIIDISEPDLFKLVHIKDDLENLLQKSIDIVRNRIKMNPYLKKHIDKNVNYV